MSAWLRKMSTIRSAFARAELRSRRSVLVIIAILGSLFTTNTSRAEGLADWKPWPATWSGAKASETNATLQASGKWSYLRSSVSHRDVELVARITIDLPAKEFAYFGEHWSVWPDATYSDQGFEAAVVLRSDSEAKRGLRVQWSLALQEVTLVRFPDGGYVQSVPCAIKQGEPLAVRVIASAATVIVEVNGQEKIRYVDRLEPAQEAGFTGVAVSSGAKVTFDDVRVSATPVLPVPAAQPHAPRFQTRSWLGKRPWIFDGHEPVLMLPTEASPTINSVKLRPGYKPQLSWNSHWDVQNQGAFAEATNHTTDVKTSGEGESVTATWLGKHVKNRFATQTALVARYDRQRDTYVYDIDSQLEVLPGEPFHFRYGFDFEHHTPLDPFNWQYLVARRRGGELYHRPVYPIDPGPQMDLEPYHGVRVWRGRHHDPAPVSPAVEYEIDPAWHQRELEPGKLTSRKLHTAVCAAFYDTGVAFEAETAKPGTKVHVKYRYTGYPSGEVEKVFGESRVYDSPTLDPRRYYVFADEWPRLTFRQHVPLSESWILGRNPFTSGHNVRPTYQLKTDCGAGSGCALQLGPASSARATWPSPQPLAKGRYAIAALVQSENAHGAGGWIALELLQAKTNTSLAKHRHFVGNGTFAWRRDGFVVEVPEDGVQLQLGFGNDGTGTMWVTDVEWSPLAEGASPPPGVAATTRPAPPRTKLPPADSLADYRMEEGNGFHVLDQAGNGHLDLANLEWVKEEGRGALRFVEPAGGEPRYVLDSGLGNAYFGHASYADKRTLPVAVAGFHGGGKPLKGITLVSWIKPAKEMGKSMHGGKGDIVGYGARRFILGLAGQSAPYQLTARVNVGESITSTEQLEADRWYQVALTAAPQAKGWRLALWLDGRQVAEGEAVKFPVDAVVPHSLVLGAELFYFHDAYYRGLIGRTVVVERVLSPAEIVELR